MKYPFKSPWKVAAVALLDGAGSLATLPSKLLPKPAHAKARNILVLRLDHWGDVLMATPIPKILKEFYAGVRVTFLTSSAGAALLENNPFVDEVITYDAPWFLREKGSKEPLASLVRRLKDKKFDLAVAPRGDLRENWMLWSSGIRTRVGYGIAGGGFFLNHQVPYPLAAHEAEVSMHLLRSMGIRVREFKPQVYFANNEIPVFEERMRSWGLDPGKRYTGFQMHSGATSKDWGREHMRTFLKAYSDRFRNEKLVLVGSQPQYAQGPWFDLTGKTSARELCLLMRYFKLFIGPDSGPTHLASSLGVPSIFLYSGTNQWSRWRPLSETAVAIRKEVSCAPCALNVCRVDGHPCMSRITPEEVLAESAHLLELNS